MFVVVLCGLFMLACSREKPDNTVINFFNTLKAGDLYVADTYVDASLFAGVEGDEVLFLQLYFKTLEFEKPIVTSLSDAHATVSVKVTAVNLDAILANFMQTMYARITADNKTLEEYSEEELNNMILEPLKDPNSPKRTLTLSLELTRQKVGGKKWLLSANENLRSGILMRSTEHDYESTETYPDENDELSKEVSVDATLLEIDGTAGLCIFKTGETSLSLNCADVQGELLKDRIGKTFPIMYRVYSKPNENKETYWLVGFE
jgi:hypothetical protein